jgi:hypothetical protein
MQADKSHLSWIEGDRQKAKYIRISMTSEDCNRHSMVSGVFTSGSDDVGVRIDPQYRKIITITFGQPGEWRYAYRALSAKREDSLRVVAAYHLQCSGQLRDYCLLRFDPVLFAKTKITRLDRNESGRSAVRWQHCTENGSPYCIASSSLLEGHFREKLANGFYARTLPLRPD